jgi:hypothetical protein
MRMNSKDFESLGNAKVNETKAKAFRQRFGKETTVETAIVNQDMYHVRIKSKYKDYVLTEKMNKGATEYVILEFDGKRRRYDSFVLAEIDIADDIGGIEYGDIG